MPEEQPKEIKQSENVMRLDEPKPYNPHMAWRELMLRFQSDGTRRSAARGDSPVVVPPIPAGVTMELGADKYGRVLVPKFRGQHARFAFDKDGRLSTGKGKGRLRPHLNPNRLALKSFQIEAFNQRRAEYEAEMRAEDAKDGKPFQGITTEELAALTISAMIVGQRQFKMTRQLKRAAARERQKASRRVNAGLVPGNAARLCYSAPRVVDTLGLHAPDTRYFKPKSAPEKNSDGQ